MNKLFLLEQIEKNTDVYITSFSQQDNILVAKSHFFDLHFDDYSMKIVDSYTLPDEMLKKYLDETLPLEIKYDFFDFYVVMLDTINEIENKCEILELRDLENI